MTSRHYIVRRLPTAAEQARMAQGARERAEKRRIVRDGVIAAVLVMATLAAILAAGAVPVHTRYGLGPIQYRHGCTLPLHHRIGCVPIRPHLALVGKGEG